MYIPTKLSLCIYYIPTEPSFCIYYIPTEPSFCIYYIPTEPSFCITTEMLLCIYQLNCYYVYTNWTCIMYVPTWLPLWLYNYYTNWTAIMYIHTCILSINIIYLSSIRCRYQCVVFVGSSMRSSGQDVWTSHWLTHISTPSIRNDT